MGMEIATSLIELAFSIMIGLTLGDLVPRAVKDSGTRARFVPCGIVLIAISTAYFLFAVGMLEGWSQADRFSAGGLLWGAFILNAIVTVIAGIVGLLLSVLWRNAKLVKA